jgi:serine/threonine protein kinase
MWKFLRHPNIVSFIGVSPMFPICLVSEWMPNGDVGQYLKMHGSADRVFFVSHQILCHPDHEPSYSIHTS